MKTYLALASALLCLVALEAADSDDKCKNDFQTFLTCIKAQYDKIPEGDKKKAKDAREDKANKCFADNGCDAPDWNKDPLGGGNGKHGMGMDMPQAVKDCLKKKLTAKIGDKLNECLSKKGVKGVNFTALADSLQASGMLEGHAEAGKEGIHGAFSAKFNTVKAVDKCSQKKGGNTDLVKPLEQCLQLIKRDEKKAKCAFMKPCEDKVSADCKQRGQEISKALCQCKKEQEAKIAGKLKTLGQSGQKVAIQDLVKSVADDQDIQGIMKDVDSCYTETNTPEPPMLQLAMKMFAGGGASAGSPQAKFAAAMSVNASTVIIMSDMLQLDADDSTECDACPDK